MSTTVDQRVVEMRFDNQQFEKATAQTLETITKLKSSLNFDGATKGLNEIEKVSNNIKFGTLSDSVLGLNKNFLNLVTSITLVQKAVNFLISSGTKLANALVIEPPKQGYQLYEQKINSIQTVVTNTGKSLEEVNLQLELLNDYSNKTIYRFSDMTTSLGKFTAAGVDLGIATKAIMGISNAAAAAGASTADAGRAMYNIAQAYSVGSMKLIDWKSIENANMATKDLKESIIEAAVEVGTLTKGADDLVRTAKGTVVNWKSLRETLNEGWFDVNVMNKVFGWYSDETTEIGKKAMAAAQDIKTFTQLIDVLKESIATGWSTTFSYIIGDFEDAKKTLTTVGNVISGTFDMVLNKQNYIMHMWNMLGGRASLLDTLKTAFVNLYLVMRPVGEAFGMIFPEFTYKNLLSITDAINGFVHSLTISGNTAANIRDTFIGLFSILDILQRVVVAVFNSLFGLDVPARSLVEVILRVSGAIGRLLQSFDLWMKDSVDFKMIMNGLSNILTSVIGTMVLLTKRTVEFLDAIDFTKKVGQSINFIGLLFNKVYQIFALIAKTTDGTSRIGMASEKLNASISSMGNIFSAFSAKIKNLLSNINPAVAMIMTITGVIALAGITITMSINSTIKSVKRSLGVYVGAGETILNTFKNTGKAIGDSFTKVGNAITDVLKPKQNVPNNILKIAAAIGILAASLYGLSKISVKDLLTSTAALSFIISKMAILAISMSVIEAKSNNSLGILLVATFSLVRIIGELDKLKDYSLSNVLSSVGTLTGIIIDLSGLLFVMSKLDRINPSVMASLLIATIPLVKVSKALQTLSDISWNQMWPALAGLSIMMASLVGVLALMKAINSDVIGAIATGLGLILAAKSLIIVSEALLQLADVPWENIEQHWVAMSIALTSLAGVFAALSVLGAATEGIGALAEIAAGFAMLEVGLGIAQAGKGLAMLAPAIKELDGLNMVPIAGGLALVALALRLFTGLDFTILSLSTILFETSVSVGVFARAFMLMTQALQTGNYALIKNNLIMLSSGLKKLVGPFAAISLLSKATSFGLLALGSAILMIGEGVLLAANGVGAFTAALVALSSLGLDDVKKKARALTYVFSEIVLTIYDLGPELFKIGYLLLPLANLLAMTAMTAVALGAAVVSFGIGLSLASLGILAFSKALIALNSVSLDQLKVNLPTIVATINMFILSVLKAGIVLGVINGPLLAFSFAISTLGLKLISFGIGVTSTAIGIQFMATALESLKDINLQDVGNGLLAIGAACLIIGATGKLLSKGAGGLIALSMGMYLFADAYALLATTVENYNLLAKLAQLGPTFKQAGTDAVKGIVEGIDDNEQKLIYAGSGIGLTVIKSLRNAVGWHSPWQLLIQAGKDAVAGLVKGITDSFPALESTVDTMGNFFDIDIDTSSWQSAVSSISDELGILKGEAFDTDSVFQDLLETLYGVGKLGITRDISVNNAAQTWLEGHGYEYVNRHSKEYENSFGFGNLFNSDFLSDIEDLTSGFNSLGGGTSAAKEELSDYQQLFKDLGSTLKNQLKGFGEFNVKFETSSASLIRNLHSQLTGIGSWEDDLFRAAEKGISEPILQELASLGPAGYDQLAAFLEMSDEQIEEYNKMYSSKMTLMENETASTIKVIAALAKAGNEEAIAQLNELGYSLDDIEIKMGENSYLVLKAKQSYDELVTSLKSSIDIFEEFDMVSAKSSGELLDNIQSQIQGMNEWSLDIMMLARRGLDKGIIQSLADSGTKSYQTIRGFLSMTQEEILKYNEMYTQSMSISDTSAKAIAASYALAGDEAFTAFFAAKPGEDTYTSIERLGTVLDSVSDKYLAFRDAGIEVASMFDSINSTISNQMDIFSQFNMETETTAEDMINNMRSQIEGITSWSSNLAELAGRGINEGLLQELTNLGPNGFAKVAAFVQMSDEQLREANDLFAQSLSLPTSVTGEILASYGIAGNESIRTYLEGLNSGISDVETTGMNIIAGLANGMNENQYLATDAATLLGLSVIENLNSALDEHSPSKETYESGLNAVLGLSNAMNDNSVIAARSSQLLGKDVLTSLNSVMSFNAGLSIGDQITNGISSGILSGIDKVKNSAITMATAAYEAAKETLGIHSPSKMFEFLGYHSDTGFAGGVLNNLNLIKSAEEVAGETAIDTLKETISKVNTLMDDENNSVFTITPQIDLSNARRAANSISSYFNGKNIRVSAEEEKAYDAENQNGVNTSNGRNIVFNQYNNSPKALDPIEIYRNTNNQLSQLRGAIKVNG